MFSKSVLLSHASQIIVPELAAGNRYVPRALGRGPAWGVWDNELGRFIADEELNQISVHDLKYANVKTVKTVSDWGANDPPS